VLKLFYLIKPLLPRWLQIRLRRLRAARILARLDGQVVDRAGLARTEFPWPGNHRAAVLVTHDVEMEDGQRNIPRLLEIEERCGVRSCWNFVVDRYPVDEALIGDLQAAGHEIGVHGLKHDGKLFSSPETWRRRLEGIAAAADRWGAAGFRSPALLHDLELLQELPLAWDSSIPAWDPFQPMPGGCGRYVPYLLNEHCVELPVTLWQDFTLFEELRRDPLPVWRAQTEAIVAAGGLVNVIVHPDYLTDTGRLERYAALLEFLTELPDTWLALPGEVADWTRARPR
jgi:peptidoglycan/xylan/chitin deacetylase (PgdA/CDA1 family)